MSTWDFRAVEYRSDAIRYSVVEDGRPVSWIDAINALQTDPSFRTQLSETISSSKFTQVFWETSPVDNESTSEHFQFALVQARLRSAADSSPFSSFFTEHDTVATFNNLSGSAVLICPAPMPDSADRSYLKPFLKTAPSTQIHELWRAVGLAVAERLSDRPVWISTSGGGVPWLHVRLDNSPKYYSYEPFKAWPRSN